MLEHYRTPAGTSRFEADKIKGSRFIASVAPAASAAEAQAFVRSVRAEFSDARHTCFAWRVGMRGEASRSGDDGEPAGSAGRPILAQIEGHGVTDVVVAVTRYFGGTKLGVGGLMRAYGGATGRALDRAEIRTVPITTRLLVEHPYECSGAVQGLLSRLGLEPAQADYGETVRLEVDVPDGAVEGFLRDLRDGTAGRAVGQVWGRVRDRVRRGE